MAGIYKDEIITGGLQFEKFHWSMLSRNVTLLMIVPFTRNPELLIIS